MLISFELFRNIGHNDSYFQNFEKLQPQLSYLSWIS
jgi:hypothetical protein